METLPAGSHFALPYRDSALSFTVPADVQAVRIELPSAPAASDPAGAVRLALASPQGSLPLRALARPGQRVCLLVTDATRPCPDYLLVPAIVEELAAAGVRDEDITILVAVGMHRASTQEEKEEKLGSEVLRRFRVVDHNGQDQGQLLLLGHHESTGIPLWVNRLAAEADLLIATGIVEPHDFAGYSGGGKTVVIGAGGEETIARSHGPALMDHPGTSLGNLEGNLFRALVEEATRLVGLRFVVNVVLNDQDQVVAAFAGDPQAAFQKAVTLARQLYTVEVPGPWDAVLAGIARPKDVNLYQASRAASRLALGSQPVVGRGGLIVLAAEAHEGAGQGVGERNFHALLRDVAEPLHFLERARREGYGAGGQRAYLVAQALAHCTIAILGARQPQVVRDLHMLPLAEPQEVWPLLRERCGPNARLLIIPHPFGTLPVLKN